MKETNIRILVCEVGKNPEVKVIPNDLKPIQDIVGGYIEAVPLDDGCYLICNEDRISLGLPQNFRPYSGMRPIRGNFFITGPADKEGNNTSLTDEQRMRWERVLALTKQPPLLVTPLGSGKTDRAKH